MDPAQTQDLFLGITAEAMDTPTEDAESGLPRIAGRSDDDERLALIIWPPSFFGPLPTGPIDPELIYKNCRAQAEIEFSGRYESWEKHNRSDPTRLVVCGNRTDIRADALIAADLRTWCCSFMCQVLEYYADYLLDCGKAGEEALRDFDQFADNLANETHEHKWLTGVKAISLCEEENADPFWRAKREMVSSVRHRFGRLAWNAERGRADEALYNPPIKGKAQPQTAPRRRELVKQYRSSHKLTMPALARRAATSVTAVYGMVKGDRTRYSKETLSRFLQVIGVSSDQW